MLALPALVEFTRLHEHYPSEPLLLLCVALSQMQLVMSRANHDRGHSVLLAFGWLDAYARLANKQDAAFNEARAYHHLGLAHIAVHAYASVLALGRAAITMPCQPAPAPALIRARGFSREAAHNLSLI